MDILYELGEASVEEVRTRLPDPPSYSTARALLARLEAKGRVRHRENELRYLYSPTVPTAEARRSAVTRLARIFFGGSRAAALTGLLDETADQLSKEEIARLESIVERVRQGDPEDA